jgi:hypothetical protein
MPRRDCCDNASQVLRQRAKQQPLGQSMKQPTFLNQSPHNSYGPDGGRVARDRRRAVPTSRSRSTATASGRNGWLSRCVPSGSPRRSIKTPSGSRSTIFTPPALARSRPRPEILVNSLE